MSYDRQIDQVCPHIVVEEALFVSTDRQTIKPVKAIASMDSVQVLFNGTYKVPTYGIKSPAEITGLQREPFNIRKDVNDKFCFRVQDILSQYTVPALNRVSAFELVKVLNETIPELNFFQDDQRIGIRSKEAGGLSDQFLLDSSSTILSTLGLPTANYSVRGSNVLPGWSLVLDPKTLLDRPKRYIVFDEPLKTSMDFVEITYNTVQADCRRCGGTGYEHDWRYDSEGNTSEVRDEALFIQEIQKLFYTLQGSNPFFNWYGTKLLNAIGKKLVYGNILQSVVVSDLYTTFARWQSIKKQQEEKVGQKVSDEEYPYRLLSATLSQSEQDPTVAYLKVELQNRSLNSVVLERGVKLPTPDTSVGAIRRSLSESILIG